MSAVLEFQTPPGKPVLRGHAFFWSVIRDLTKDGDSFTVHAILQHTNRTHRSTVADYVRRLVKAGYAEETGERVRVNRGPLTPIFKLKRRPAQAPSLNRDGSAVRQGRGQKQMWNVLRGPEGREGVTAADLVLRASTDETAVTVATARSYLRKLAGAGYLVSPRRGVWRLKPSMNTGPKPPLILRTKIVFDANRNAAMAPIAAEEDRP